MLVLVLDELLVDVLVLVDELVPVLLCESASLEQEPFEQLRDRGLELLVDFDTVTDLLPIRIGAGAMATGMTGIWGAAEDEPATALKTIAANAISPRCAMACSPDRRRTGRRPVRHLNTWSAGREFANWS